MTTNSNGLEIYDWDGVPIALGMLMPETRPETFRAYADSAPMYTRSQILDVINDPKRVAARKRFAAELWIKNQGGRGSCNGFAGATALEKARVRRGLKHEKLSGEGLYAQINGGRDGGSMLDDGMKAIMENGVPLQSLIPGEEYLWRNVSKAAKDSMARFKALECYRVDTEDELASGLAAGFDAVIAVHVGGSFSSVDGGGRVPPVDGPGNHSVSVDDIREFNGELEFDMVNSWGRRFGQDGRGWVSWKRHLRTTSRNHAFYLVRSTNDDPQGDNPPKIVP